MVTLARLSLVGEEVLIHTAKLTRLLYVQQGNKRIAKHLITSALVKHPSTPTHLKASRRTCTTRCR